MKIKITESQLKRIIERYTEEGMINEAWYDDALDFVKSSYETVKGKTKEVFKDLTGVDFDKKDNIKIDEVPTNKEIKNKIEDIKKDVKIGKDKEEKDTKEKKPSGYGTGNWDGKLTITYGNDAAYPAANEANAISITRTASNDNLPFLNLQDDNGNLIQFQPTAFYLKGNEISVRGFKKQGGKDVDSYISYNKNKQALKSQMNGYDVMEDFIQKNNPTDNTGTSTGTGSTGASGETPEQAAARMLEELFKK